MTNKSILSIDIGTYKTKVAVGKYENNLLCIEQAFSIPTPDSSFSDGKLQNDPSKRELLKKNLQQALVENRVRIKDTAITIQSTATIRRELEIPPVKPQEMESMIRYEIEQYLPIDLSEYIIEYKVSEEQKDNKSRVLIAALPKAVAEEYIDLLHSVKLEPVFLDIHSNSISKLFSMKQQINHNPNELDKTAAFIDLGCSSTNISILSKGSYQFSRIMPGGGKDINRSIAEAFGISMEEAEKKKLAEADLSKFGTSNDMDQLNQIVGNMVNRQASDIQRVFQYYKTRHADNNIDEIYLYGGTSNLKGLSEYLTRVLNIPAQQIKSLSGVKLESPFVGAGVEYYLNAIGAMLRK